MVEPTTEVLYPFKKHSDTNKDIGGLDITDNDASNAKLVLEIMKNLSKKLLKLEIFDMLKFSRPAKITSPLTVLMCCANEYIATDLLDKASEATDPIERMKYVLTYLFSGISCGPDICKSKAPFNPIIGETYQAINEGGARLFMEQTLHHPPTFNYHIVGANNAYQLMGYGAINAQLDGLNTIRGWRDGKNILKFKDGTFMSFTLPLTRIHGVMMGNRTYNYSGTLVIKDYTHKIECTAKFPDEISETILQKMFSKKKTVQYDEFKVEIRQLNPSTKEKEIKATGCGTWLGQIVFNNQIYWSYFDKRKPWTQEGLFILPSDSIHRTDMNFIKQNDVENGQIEKDKVENLQRTDQKLRDDYAEKNKTK